MNTPNLCNSEHEFVLVLSGSTDLDDSLMDALFEAGCDDATPSLKYGRISMMFTRVAPSFQEAVYTAIRDVKKTGLADVYSMDECSLVSQADIARRIGKSRQYVGQCIAGTKGPGGFPGPVCGISEGHSLWSWCEVSFWLWENGISSKEKLDESRTVAAINAILDWNRQRLNDPLRTEELMQLTSAVVERDRTE